MKDKTIKCWGANASGQLGQGHADDLGDEWGEMGNALPAVDLGAGRTALQVACGDAMTCALLDDGSVQCWGDNQAGGGGNLGLGHTDNVGDEPGEMGAGLSAVNLGDDFVPVEIALGYATACARDEAGQVKCWGHNLYGTCLTDNAEPTTVIGDSASDMGGNLSAINVGTGIGVRSLVAHGHAVCAIVEDGTARCWGDNTWGGLGMESSVNSWGGSANQGGDNLPVLDL